MTTMIAAQSGMHEGVPQAEATEGLVRLRLAGPITPSTAPQQRSLIRNPKVSRALNDSETISAFRLWRGLVT